MKTYEILSNPKTRHLYDNYGQFGLSVYSNTGSIGLTEFVLDTKKQAWLLFFLSLLLITFFLFPFLVAMKLSGKITTYWVVIFVPVWLFHLILYGLIILLAVATARYARQQREAEEVADENEGRYVHWFLVMYLPLICFTISLALKLDGFVQFSWQLIVLPYFLFEGIYLMYKIFELIETHQKWPGHDEVLLSVPNAFVYQVYARLRWSLARLVFVAVATVRLDNILPLLEWKYGFFFMYLCFVIAPIADIIYYRAYKFAASETANVANLPNKYWVIASFCIQIVCTCFMLVFFGLLQRKLQPVSALSWITVFMPFLILSGGFIALLTLCMPCLFYCCIAGRPSIYDELGDEEAPPVNMTRPPSSAAQFGYALSPYQPRITMNNQ